MTTGSILAVDLVIAVLAAAGWLGGGAAAAARRRRLSMGLAVFAVLATLARAVTVTALARAGWWFAAEKVLIAAPLSAAGVVAAGVGLLRSPTALLFAGYASTGGLLVTVLHGYPVSAGAGLLAAAGVAAATGVSWRLLGRLSRRVSRTALVVAAAALVSGTGLTAAPVDSPDVSGIAAPVASPGVSGVAAPVASPGVSGVAAPVASPGVSGVAAPVASPEVLGIGAPVASSPVPEHAAPGMSPHVRGDHAPGVGEPTQRITLTAGTATVRVSGRDVPAWAFNGQVPGPELTATLGDVLEVTLRNVDIERGVTLHWHGYDVPNSQDGVPGVTQEAVLPGREFVYRFRADQVGTYWYHTHAVSDVGVRMGLYGMLVVHPAPATGIDVTVPVHTLAGHPLPAPRTEPVPAGRPVRLRLVNTDNTTHRYALAGTAFRVAAIDGYDLEGPAPLAETAVLIPAGGRYDLVFTAPPAPVALFVDGRAVYSTGPVRTVTSGWPVLDPLTYGAGALPPWSTIDRELTLVLDRGLDLRGLLPRYAHTVNGAADPDIPHQVVRHGETVQLTIVNRSMVVHPWHLHGHHVLVLSRDGKPAKPLWLDSFDVRPGEVWKVAFAADNPGMWANHCHNLAHVDAGMTLHLMYA